MKVSAFHKLLRVLLLPVFFLIFTATTGLRAQNNTGCNAQFSYQAAPGSMTVAFYPMASMAAAQYNWNFGDGSQPSNLPAPQHLFLQPGAYWVCLTISVATSAGTQCTAQWCDSVRVGMNTGSCNPQFTWSSANVVNGIQFSPALNGSAATYSWSFGDGGTSTQLNPVHVYPGPGAYLACLTVTNGTCVNTYCDSVRIVNNTVNCDAHFSATSTSTNSSTFFFQPLMNSTATRYQWSFGDGTTDTLRTPTHLYSQPGTYWACLTVTRYTAAGTVACTATWCDSIRVNSNTSTLCDAHFSHQFAQTTNAVYFNPVANPSGTTYSWNFGDGSVSNMRTPTHVYTQPGAYLVCLNVNVTGPNGGVTCTASWCDSVIITQVPSPCSARFAWSVNNATQTASFRPQTITVNNTYSWNFGDGTTSTVMNPTHAYASPGVYYVCLTVTRVSNTSGSVCTDTWCDSIRVNAPLPPNCNASFNFYRQMNAGFTFRFVPMTMVPGTVYLWQFGDGDTSTLRTPVHTYADTGVYHVCLTVVTTNSAGSCSATVCRNLVVRSLWTANSFCSAAFAYNRVPNVPGLFQFTAFSSGGSLRYSWNFGDSTTSNQPNPLHQYTAAGAYNICLTVRDTITNCTSRICRWLLLGPNLMPTDPESEEDEAADRLSEQTSALQATVFPNPAEDHVTLLLSGTSGNATCSVSDVTGKVVFELAGVSDGSYTLPFDSFSPGIYIFRIIEAGQAPFTGRFLVK